LAPRHQVDAITKHAKAWLGNPTWLITNLNPIDQIFAKIKN